MTVPPLRREVLVCCDPATAYRLFVNDIGTWWPVGSHSVFGAGSTVALDDTRFVETSTSGQTAIWGTITEATAPRRVAFSWHPGFDPADATHVEVTFTPTGDQNVTLVTLVHTGWEACSDPTAARDNYAGGWIVVLDRLTARSSPVGRCPTIPAPA